MKRLQLARAPPSLCLHLKRTVWLPSGYLHKSTVPVSFPSQLDLTALTKTPTPQSVSLYTIIMVSVVFRAVAIMCTRQRAELRAGGRD